MPISFSVVRQKLLVRLNTLDRAFERHILTPSVSRYVDRFALQEGLLSSLWQAWCEFCRDVVIGAVQGATTTTGIVVSSQAYAARTEAEIAYIAKQLAQQRNVTTIKPISGRYSEPTWGDVNKLNLIVTGLGPSNQQTLLSGFGGVTSIKDLQICRNASAHINGENIAKVRAARVRYLHTAFKHPSDTMRWIVPTTKDYLWRSWIDEMELVSDLATQ